MLSTLGLVLIGLSVFGILAMAAKFGLGPVPADYHAEILARGGTDPVPSPVVTVLGAIYRTLAGLLIGVALGLTALTLELRASGGAVVFLAMAGMVLAAGGITALVTLRVERETGVRTPWRLATALVVMALLGIVLI